MSKKRKRRPLSEIEIKLGDLFLLTDVLRPNNLDHALDEAARRATGQDELTCAEVREDLRLVYYNIFAALQNEEMHSPAGGPRGPRLPAGVRWIDLLPHLSKAKHILESKEIPFEKWVREYQWPADMKVHPRTLRGWLTRYAKQITAYKPRDAKEQPVKSTR